jgi:hypothetical protein
MCKLKPPKRSTCVYLPEDLHAEAREYADKQDTTLSDLVTKGLRLALADESVPVNTKEI